MTEKTESTDSTDSNDSTDDIALVKPTVISNKDVKHALKLNIVFGLHMGSGTYANVFKARYESKMVAMKVTDYASSCKRLAKQELSVLQILKDKPHKYIVKFIEYFYNRDKTYVWFLLEWFNGMDMADKLDYNKGPFSEKVAKHYFIQIVDAIKFLHTQNIVHRDIKMDNVLVGPIDQSKNVTDVDHLSECVKIIDFGFAKIVEINEDDRAMCSSKIGTEAYMAPELLDYKSHSDYDAFKADIYSLAILLFAILYNDFPDRTTTSNGELKPQYVIHFPDNEIKVSDSAKQLISGMGCADSRKRFNIIQILDSKWIKDN